MRDVLRKGVKQREMEAFVFVKASLLFKSRKDVGMFRCRWEGANREEEIVTVEKIGDRLVRGQSQERGRVRMEVDAMLWSCTLFLITEQEGEEVVGRQKI